MPSWTISPFDAQRHDCGDFDCGEPSLDTWLKQYASQNMRRDLVRVHVLIEQGQERVMGYYGISTCSIAYTALPKEHSKKLPRQQTIPGVLLGRLAVDQSLQGQKVFGPMLLFDAMKQVVRTSEIVGMHAIVVDALNDRVAGFYERFQFERFEDDRSRLFLPISTARKVVNSGDKIELS